MADDPKPRSPNPNPQTQIQTQAPTLSPPEFSHLIAKIAVAQICQSFGFRGAQSSALDALTRVATLYIQSLAESTASRAAVSGGRTQCNLFDVAAALEDLRLPSGFPGAGYVDQPLLGSCTLEELNRFVNTIDEVPFARRIPRPETDSGSVGFPEMSRCSVRRGAEVPTWLPWFPEVVEEPKRVSRREACWEANAFDQPAPMAKTVKDEKKGDGGFLLSSRRERVKFRLAIRNGKVGVDDLELRNGVCRGGKMVCLAKRVNTFLEEDEEDGIEVENEKSR